MYRLIALAVLVSVCLFAQSDRGTITGTVTDPSGSLIPNVAVTAVNTATGVELRTQTTDTGNYTIPSVPAGTYNIVVEVTGFRKFEQQGMRVQVAQTARVDVTMQVGSATESITVTADAPLLRTENAAQATTVGREQLNATTAEFRDRRGRGSQSAELRAAFAGRKHQRVEHDSRERRSLRHVQDHLRRTGFIERPRCARFGRIATLGRSARRVHAADIELLGGVRPGGRRTVQFHCTLGHEPVSRDAVRLLRAREALRRVVRSPTTRSGKHVRPQVRRHDLGANIGGPVVLPKAVRRSQSHILLLQL